MANEDMLSKLKMMQARFYTALPNRLADIDAALQACRDQPRMRDHLEELHRLLHMLAGAAGTFGCDALGLQAREFERQVERWLAESTWGLRDFDRLALLLPQLQAYIDHAPLELPQQTRLDQVG